MTSKNKKEMEELKQYIERNHVQPKMKDAVVGLLTDQPEGHKDVCKYLGKHFDKLAQNPEGEPRKEADSAKTISTTPAVALPPPPESGNVIFCNLGVIDYGDDVAGHINVASCPFSDPKGTKIKEYHAKEFWEFFPDAYDKRMKQIGNDIFKELPKDLLKEGARGFHAPFGYISGALEKFGIDPEGSLMVIVCTLHEFIKARYYKSAGPLEALTPFKCGLDHEEFATKIQELQLAIEKYTTEHLKCANCIILYMDELTESSGFQPTPHPKQMMCASLNIDENKREIFARLLFEDNFRATSTARWGLNTYTGKIDKLVYPGGKMVREEFEKEGPGAISSHVAKFQTFMKGQGD